MEKNNAIPFIEGAVAGLALGVAATLFLSSNTGKKLRKDMQSTLADFYQSIAPQIKRVVKMGEKEYKDFMEQAAKQYGKSKKMTEENIKDLVKETQKSWAHFSKNLAEE